MAGEGFLCFSPSINDMNNLAKRLVEKNEIKLYGLGKATTDVHLVYFFPSDDQTTNEGVEFVHDVFYISPDIAELKTNEVRCTDLTFLPAAIIRSSTRFRDEKHKAVGFVNVPKDLIDGPVEGLAALLVDDVYHAVLEFITKEVLPASKDYKIEDKIGDKTWGTYDGLPLKTT